MTGHNRFSLHLSSAVHRVRGHNDPRHRSERYHSSMSQPSSRHDKPQHWWMAERLRRRQNDSRAARIVTHNSQIEEAGNHSGASKAGPAITSRPALSRLHHPTSSDRSSGLRNRDEVWRSTLYVRDRRKNLFESALLGGLIRTPPHELGACAAHQARFVCSGRLCARQKPAQAKKSRRASRTASGASANSM